MYIRNVSPYDGGVFHQVGTSNWMRFREKLMFLTIYFVSGSAASSDICTSAECQRIPSPYRRLLLDDRSRKRKRIGDHIRFRAGCVRKITFSVA